MTPDEGKDPVPVIEHVKRALEAGKIAGLDPPPLGTSLRGLFSTGGMSGSYQSGRTVSKPSEAAEISKTGDVGIEALREELRDCRRCKLWQGRTNIVFGEGSPQARLVFVGEGPGREEDLQGRPFVGDAGKMLTKIITNGMGLSREDVYICNVVKCRPPGNRDPEQDEVAACLPFLTAQLAAIKPEVICVLGRVAGIVLLGKEFKITRDRGRWYSYNGIPLMPTFHPAYILRGTGREREIKKLVWDDIKQVMKRMGLEVG